MPTSKSSEQHDDAVRSPAPPTRSRRVTINFSRDTYDVLSKIAASRGPTLADCLRIAIGLNSAILASLGAEPVDASTLVESHYYLKRPKIYPATAREIIDYGSPRQAAVVEATSEIDQVIRELCKNPQLARKVPSRKFEQIVAELIRTLGFEVELTRPSRDGGYDVAASQNNGLGHALYIVECKRYREDRKVGVEVVRALCGVVERTRATGGVVVTTSFFTKNAKLEQVVFERRIHLHDYNALQQWFGRYDKNKTAQVTGRLDDHKTEKAVMRPAM